jgi:hypothetical protein
VQNKLLGVLIRIYFVCDYSFLRMMTVSAQTEISTDQLLNVAPSEVAAVRKEPATARPRKTDNELEELLDYDSASAFLGIAKSTLKAWICTGRYRVPHIKSAAKLNFFRKSLSTWRRSRERNRPKVVVA